MDEQQHHRLRYVAQAFQLQGILGCQDSDGFQKRCGYESRSVQSFHDWKSNPNNAYDKSFQRLSVRGIFLAMDEVL